MPPSVPSIAQQLYDRVAHLAVRDEAYGWALLYFCEAQGLMLQEVDDLAAEGDEGPGWSQLVDINRTPSKALSWLAQFNGVTTRDDLADSDQRDRIVNSEGFNRGTSEAIRSAVKPYLTGSKAVLIHERDPNALPSDPPYGLTVITYTTQTPIEEWSTNNLIENSGADTDITGWFSENHTTVVRQTGQARSGTGSVEATTTAGGDPQTGIRRRNGNRYPVLPNTEYTVSVYQKMRSNYGIRNGSIRVLYYNSGGAALGSEIWGPRIPLATSYKRISTTFITPVGAASIRVIVYSNEGATPVGEIYDIDDAQLEAASQATVFHSRDDISFAYVPRPAGSVLILNVLNEAKPAGLIMKYKVMPGQDFEALRAHGTFQKVKDDFADFEAVRDNPAGI